MGKEQCVAWCVLCGGRYSEAEIKGRKSCPGCGSRGVPCDPAKDVAMQINWHELRILGIWAGNWADRSKEGDPAMPPTIQAIARRLEQQFPDFGPLTMQGELQGLREEFGQVDAIGIGPTVPLPVNGPGAAIAQTQSTNEGKDER